MFVSERQSWTEMEVKMSNKSGKYNKLSSDDYKIEKYVPNKIDYNQEEFYTPALNVDEVTNLISYLDSQKNEKDFPEVIVMPDFLRSILKFINERTTMKYSHQEIVEKINLVADSIDKKYDVEMKKLQNATELNFAQITANFQQNILSINNYYNIEKEKYIMNML